MNTPYGAQYHLPIMLQPIAAATARTAATAEEQAVPAALATYSSLAAARLETMAAKIDTIDAKLNAATRFRRGWMAALTLLFIAPVLAAWAAKRDVKDTISKVTEKLR
jgi:hypothetical protein